MKKLKNKAFTLIELLVEVAIIGILAAVGVTTFGGFQDKAKVSASKAIHKGVQKKLAAELVKCSLGDTTIFNSLSCSGVTGSGVVSNIGSGGAVFSDKNPYVGANWGAATFTATIAKVLPNSLILSNVGPLPTAVPTLGSQIKGYDGSSDTGVTAQSGVYRYSREDVPPVPLDNQGEKYDIYDVGIV